MLEVEGRGERSKVYGISSLPCSMLKNEAKVCTNTAYAFAATLFARW
jgi:hypothetical protein